MHIVLRAIRNYWKEEDMNGRTLPDDQTQDLKRLTHSCKDALLDTQALLDKHQKLGKGLSLGARMKWAPKDIGPVRNRLLLRTTLLATFNSAITAQAQSDFQRRHEAELLEALNRIHLDFEQGTRKTTAMSQVTLEELNGEENKAWKEIAAELEGEGVSPDSIQTNRAFVRSWIDKVIMDDISEQGETDLAEQTVERSADVADAERYSHALANLNEEYPAGVSPETPVEQQSMVLSDGDQVLQRTQSVSSHASQESTWRPFKGPNRDYVQGLLAKLLRHAQECQNDQENSPRNEKIPLLAKRIYHQLDWFDRGYLFRVSVEDELRLAARDARVPLSEETLIDLVASGDKNKDGKIDCPELVELAFNIVQRLNESYESALEADVEKQIEQGLESCNRDLRSYFSGPGRQVLPWGWRWEHNASSAPRFVYALEDIKRQENPSPTLSSGTLTTMVARASRIFMPRLARWLDSRSDALQTLQRDVLDEYQQPIENAISAATIFLQFEHMDTDARGARRHPLDIVMAVKELLDLSDLEQSQNEDLKSLDALHTSLRRLSGMIAGFIEKLDHLTRPYTPEPPPLHIWREARMRSRAWSCNNLMLQIKARNDINQIVTWHERNQSFVDALVKRAMTSLQHTATVRATQMDLRDRCVKRTIKVSITSGHAITTPTSRRLRMRTTLQLRGFESSFDSILKNELRVSSDPVWNERATWENNTTGTRSKHVATDVDSVLSVEIRYINYNGRSSIMTGSANFRLKDLVDFTSTEHQTITIPLKNDENRGTITLRVTVLPRENEVVTSIEEYLGIIFDSTIPDPWRREATADGRSFLLNCEGSRAKATTVACRLDALTREGIEKESQASRQEKALSTGIGIAL
ncbi:MAG: hypothetical protein M1822_003638 [Bathelium mastoideum]|nr:MAG: hypothetical protein M1822_003638 [Bathelium mastoideum]